MVCKCCGKELIPSCGIPGCRAHVDVYSRVVGYYRPITMWNDGKQQEFEDRVNYTFNGEQKAD